MHQTIRNFSSIQYVPGLDGIRAIAVTMVILFHYTSVFALELDQLGGFWMIVAKGLNVGWIGVDIFFVVSGFLIAQILAARPIESLDAYNNFIARRIRRLVPAYVACLLVFSVVAMIFASDSKVFHNQYRLWTLTANIGASFGDRSALGDGIFSLLHFWSLALEWHFYLLLPLVLRLSGSAARSALILILLAVTCRLTFIGMGMSDNAVYSFTFCRIDSLAIGVLLSVWHTKFSHRLSKSIGILGICLLATLLLTLVNSGWRFKTLIWVQIFGYSAISTAVAMILVWVLNAPKKSMLLNFLETNWLAAVGRSSYSLYIWHLVFFPSIVKFARTNVEGSVLQYLVTLLVSVAVTALLGAASYRWVEQRFLQRKSGLSIATA